MKKKLRRRFLGEVYTRKTYEGGMRIPTWRLKFEDKHLKAYLKGYDTFTFGYNELGEKVVHRVKQEYYYE